MSDLISRSELIKALKVHFDSCFREDGELLYSDHICTSDDVVDLIKLVERQPTAHDVDKVIEELEKTMQDLNVIEVLSHIDFDSIIQNGLDNFLKAYNSELLRIVKQGSVSDDCCEWKKSKDYPFDWFVGCDGCEVSHKQGDYCPRCGKKIKAVE